VLANASKASKSLPPLYSSTKESDLAPPGKNLREGYPLTPNLYPKPLLTVASTLATLTYPFKAVANFFQTGIKFLQCPHQGA
jgi:hypothetical protein